MRSRADTDAIIGRLTRLVGGLDIAVPADQIADDTFLFEGGLGLDSFAVVELIVAVEQEFGIEFPEEDLAPESFQNLRTLAAVVGRAPARQD